MRSVCRTQSHPKDAGVSTIDNGSASNKCSKSRVAFQGTQVDSMALSSDGCWLAIGCSNPDDVVVLDSKTFQVAGRFSGHTKSIYGVDFSRDASLVASCGTDKTVRVWERKSGKCLLQLHEDDWMQTVRFSPCGSKLVGCCWDGSVKLWDIQRGTCVSTMQGRHAVPVLDVAMSPDGDKIASVSEDGTLRLYSSVNGACEKEMRHGTEAHAIAFSGDGSLLATSGATKDHTIKLWDATSGVFLRSVRTGHSDIVRRIAFAPDNERIATASQDGCVHLINVATGRCHASLAGHIGWVLGVAFDPAGNRLLSCSMDETVREWNMDAPAR